MGGSSIQDRTVRHWLRRYDDPRGPHGQPDFPADVRARKIPADPAIPPDQFPLRGSSVKRDGRRCALIPRRHLLITQRAVAIDVFFFQSQRVVGRGRDLFGCPNLGRSVLVGQVLRLRNEVNHLQTLRGSYSAVPGRFLQDGAVLTTSESS